MTDEAIGGWREHPDFSTYSDARLDQAQRLIDENIRWAKQAGDPTIETYNELEMRMLHQYRSIGKATNPNGHSSGKVQDALNIFGGSIK